MDHFSIDESDDLFYLLLESISVYSKIRDCFVDVFKEGDDIDSNYTRFAVSQMRFYSSRIQSLTLLLQQGKLWDADILMRSALECASRFLFVSTSAERERNNLISEFSDDLFDIHRIERSEKTKSAAKHSKDPDDIIIFTGATLRAEEELELRTKWPKNKRKAMKQKWSFSEIVTSLERIKEKNLDLSSYSSLQHSYAIGSHFVHADITAILVSEDRESREENERILLSRSHFSRLAVEPTDLFYICLRGMIYAIGSKIITREIEEKISKIHEKARIFHDEFFESQKDFYGS